MDQAKLLTFSGTIEASDSARRVISGKIVPFGEIGQTSAGAVVFEKGSIAIPNELELIMSKEEDLAFLIKTGQIKDAPKPTQTKKEEE